MILESITRPLIGSSEDIESMEMKRLTIGRTGEDYEQRVLLWKYCLRVGIPIHRTNTEAVNA